VVTLAMRQGIDFIETFVPLFLDRRFPCDPGGSDIARVKITVADDFDGIDSIDFLFHQFKYRRAEVPGDSPVRLRARQAVFQEDMAEATIPRTEAIQ